MSPLASPVLASTSAKIGTSISTPLVVVSPWRTTGDWAKPMTATSVTARWPPSQVMGVGLVRRVRLAGGEEVIDVLRRGPPLVARFPERPDPHAHPDLARVTAQDQVLERDVRAVEQYRGGHVRRRHPLPGIRHIHYAERGHGAMIGQLHLVGGRHPAGGAGPARRNVNLAAGGAALPARLPIRKPPKEPPRPGGR